MQTIHTRVYPHFSDRQRGVWLLGLHGAGFFAFACVVSTVQPTILFRLGVGGGSVMAYDADLLAGLWFLCVAYLGAELGTIRRRLPGLVRLVTDIHRRRLAGEAADPPVYPWFPWDTFESKFHPNALSAIKSWALRFIAYALFTGVPLTLICLLLLDQGIHIAGAPPGPDEALRLGLALFMAGPTLALVLTYWPLLTVLNWRPTDAQLAAVRPPVKPPPERLPPGWVDVDAAEWRQGE